MNDLRFLTQGSVWYVRSMKTQEPGTNVGDAVAAYDDDGDTLTYTLEHQS